MPVLQERPAASDTFERLLKRRSQNAVSSNQERLYAAFADAVEMYGDQVHWTGQAYIDHCLGVLESYLPFGPDDDGVIACLLHHALDTKKRTLDELEQQYGKDVRSIISGVHLLSHVTMEDRRMSLENLRLMFLRVSDDIRVVLLILCDHHYKLSRLHLLTPEQRRNICRDVLQLFAPVAARLGIYSLKQQMESRAFPVMYAVDATRIADQLMQIRSKHGNFLPKTAAGLEKLLRESGIRARVEAREKSPYSIFQKMRLKSLTHVEDIYDLFALRVIVDDEGSCYQALGMLHRIGHPVANRFKDYIAFPKPNGYQSLHTTLARLPGVPEGMFIEVQIRTPDMHREADLGIAAHWSYKEGGGSYASRKARLQRALTVHQPMEEDGKRSILTDHIFALTPTGDIIELPEGSTPLDFAFNVHTMLGLCFKGARVNGHIVPITYHLENGDIVEIIKHKDPHPSAGWLTVLRTSSAKSRLKRYLVSQDRPSYVQLGRESMNNELTRYGLPVLDPDLSVMRVFDGKKLTRSEREDLLMKIGQGAQNAASLLPHLGALDTYLRERAEEEKQRIPSPTTAAVARVEGSIPLPVRYAKCCSPQEGERTPITGVIGRDGYVRIHRRTCKLTQNANPERRIPVRWEVMQLKKA